MSRRRKNKNRATLIGLLKEKQEGFGRLPYFGPMGVSMVQRKGDSGVLSCQVFNLRPQDDNNGVGYMVWLTGSSEGRDYSTAIGEITPGNSGQGGGQWEFDTVNVQNCGRTIDEFDRVAIVANGLPASGVGGDLVILEGTLGKTENFYGSQIPGLTGHLDGVESPIQLIGLTFDEDGHIQYLVHGIRGKYNVQNQPQQGKTGYVYWHLGAWQEEEPGMGFWLVYLDPKTGQIVYPHPITTGHHN